MWKWASYNTPRLIAGLTSAVCLAACSTAPKARLVGKWQSKLGTYSVYTGVPASAIRFQFFDDGTVVESVKVKQLLRQSAQASWRQYATGNFRFIDSTHVEVDFGLVHGKTVYSVKWLGAKHVRLRASDEIIELERLR